MFVADEDIRFLDGVETVLTAGVVVSIVPAVPALLKLLDDENDTVRKSATNAIKAIDPEAAAKQGIK